MSKAERHLEKYRSQTSQLKPFKNRKYYDFGEMVEHSYNENKFMNHMFAKKK